MKQLTLLLALVSLLILISSAAIADSKTLPATVCMPETQGQVYSVAPQGGLSTPTTFERMLFSCPVLRENTNNSPILELEVRVTRIAGPAKTVRCRAYSTNQWGGIISNQLRTSASRSAGTNTLLRFTNIPTRWKGAVNLSCEIPAGHRLHNIYWKE